MKYTRIGSLIVLPLFLFLFFFQSAHAETDLTFGVPITRSEDVHEVSIVTDLDETNVRIGTGSALTMSSGCSTVILTAEHVIPETVLKGKITTAPDMEKATADETFELVSVVLPSAEVKEVIGDVGLVFVNRCLPDRVVHTLHIPDDNTIGFVQGYGLDQRSVFGKVNELANLKKKPCNELTCLTGNYVWQVIQLGDSGAGWITDEGVNISGVILAWVDNGDFGQIRPVDQVLIDWVNTCTNIFDPSYRQKCVFLKVPFDTAPKQLYLPLITHQGSVTN